MDRSSKQKIKNDVLELNQTWDQIKLGDIYRTFHPMEPEYTSSQVYTKPPLDRYGDGRDTGAFRRRPLLSQMLLSLSGVWVSEPLSMGFPRQESWSGLPFPSPGDPPDPGIKPKSLALAGGFFTIWATTEAPKKYILHMVQIILFL